tara:strand:- start:25 stop:255 length:231 start_codon:yes stop_codon:yes gene_type:complete
MKVGNLVKVYHFSHDAREKLTQQGERRPDLKRQGIDAHYVGLVVATSDNDPKHRRVMRCVDGEWEDYNVNRLEVIA